MYPNRKIKNKRRVGFRGSKKRQSVFRASLNCYWEKVYEQLVIHLCKDNNLAVSEYMADDERIPWEHTWDKLKKDFSLTTRSIRDIQMEVDRSQFE